MLEALGFFCTTSKATSFARSAKARKDDGQHAYDMRFWLMESLSMIENVSYRVI
jgi:hypothetical protein